MLRFAVAEHPYIGGNAGVIEEIERQGEDRLQPIIFYDPTADVALALASVSRKQRRPVMHLCNAAAQRRCVVHFCRHVGKEEHLAIAGASDQRVLRIPGMGQFEALVAHSVFATHRLQVFLPAFSVGWIQEHEVEFTGGEGIVRECRPFRAANNMVGIFALTLQQYVCLADGVGLAIDLLPIQMGADFAAMRAGKMQQRFFRDSQHATRATNPVIEQIRTGLDGIRDRQEDEIRHQFDGIAGCPVFASFLVVFFVELAN